MLQKQFLMMQCNQPRRQVHKWRSETPQLWRTDHQMGQSPRREAVQLQESHSEDREHRFLIGYILGLRHRHETLESVVGTVTDRMTHDETVQAYPDLKTKDLDKAPRYGAAAAVRESEQPPPEAVTDSQDRSPIIRTLAVPPPIQSRDQGWSGIFGIRSPAPC